VHLLAFFREPDDSLVRRAPWTTSKRRATIVDGV
jgi:hypothetical protein